MILGWYRAEVIGALTSVLLIWVVTGILVYLAIQRVISETFELDAQLMLITSAIGAVINLMSVLNVLYCKTKINFRNNRFNLH